jgi:hypothetical protein
MNKIVARIIYDSVHFLKEGNSQPLFVKHLQGSRAFQPLLFHLIFKMAF